MSLSFKKFSCIHFSSVVKLVTSHLLSTWISTLFRICTQFLSNCAIHSGIRYLIREISHGQFETCGALGRLIVWRLRKSLLFKFSVLGQGWGTFWGSMLKLLITFGEITSSNFCNFQRQIRSSSSIFIHYKNYILIINSSASRVTVFAKITPYPKKHYRLCDLDGSTLAV